MDDETPPKPGLCLAINSIVHIAVAIGMVGLCGLVGVLVMSMGAPTEAIAATIMMSIATTPFLVSAYLDFKGVFRREYVEADLLAGLYFLFGSLTAGFGVILLVVLIPEKDFSGRDLAVVLALLIGLTIYLFGNGILHHRWADRLQRWQNDAGPRCPTCSYSLRGLSGEQSETCPECGAGIVEALKESTRQGIPGGDSGESAGESASSRS